MMLPARQLQGPVLSRRVLRVFGVVRRKTGQAKLSADAEKAEWRAVDQIKRATERPIMRTAQQLFTDQMKEVTSRLRQLEDRLMKTANVFERSWEADESRQWNQVQPRLRAHLVDQVLKDDLIIGTVFDLTKWDREVLQRFTPEIQRVLREGFLTGLQRIDVRGVDFSSDSPAARQAISDTAAKTRRINETTHQKLVELISRELPRVTNMDELVRMVEGRFRQWRGPRAAMIAETVGASGFEAGQHEAFAAAGIPATRWLSQRDGRVRPAHWEADGQTVPIGERFRVMGELLRFPADPRSRKPANVIRCRCTATPAEMPEDEPQPDAGGDEPAVQDTPEEAGQPAGLGTYEFQAPASKAEAIQRLARLTVSGNTDQVDFAGATLPQLTSILEGLESTMTVHRTAANQIGWQQKRRRTWGVHIHWTDGSGDLAQNVIRLQKTFVRNAQSKAEGSAKSFARTKTATLRRLDQTLEAGNRPEPVLQRLRRTREEVLATDRFLVAEWPGVDPLMAVAKHEAYHAVWYRHNLKQTFHDALRRNGVSLVADANHFGVSEYGASKLVELWPEAASAIDLGVPIPDAVRRAVIETLETIERD